MYEQHFELTDRPFGSSPDPTFYFDSRGHRRALAYLRYAADQGDSLILLTGDIGTGKTMLVCKLLAELDAKSIVSAHLVSTQLDALELLTALTRALGGVLSGRSRDEMRAALQSFLATLAATGRKALAVIDEAQSLRPDALAEVIDLARPQLGSGAPLQFILVGQPELGRRLPVGEAEGARRLIFLACHLGPLAAPETRAYIEHRLRQVHWHGSPSLSSEAFLRIHQATDGVPRRINRLCDRLLLAACLRDLNSISAELVARTDAELNAELDGGAPVFDAGTADAAPRASAWRMRPQAQDSIPVLDSAVEDIPRPEPTAHAVVKEAARSDTVAAPHRPSRVDVAGRPRAGVAPVDRAWRKPAAVLATLAVASLIVLGVYRSARDGAAPMARDAPSGATGDEKREPDTSRTAAQEPRLAPAEATAPAPPEAPIAAAATPIEIAPRAGPPALAARRREAKTTPRAAETTRPASPGVQSAAADGPPPAPGPCTAAVAALGLCDPSSNRGQE